MWSVGVVLYILLCGSPPFYAESDDELFELIVTGTFDFYVDQWGHISEEGKFLFYFILFFN